MKFREIKIPKDRNWTKIYKQLDLENYHLIKYEDGWVASKIEPAGWAHSQHPNGMPDKIFKLPHSWHFDYGPMRLPFEGSSMTEAMSDKITEIWEIDDPDLIAKNAKNLLNRSTNSGDDEVMTGPANFIIQYDHIGKN